MGRGGLDPYRAARCESLLRSLRSGTYRIEIPDTWNGELVLWAHGYTANAGAQGSRLRVGVPGVGQGSPLRQHLVAEGFAWAASSYRCNGYVPGRGLLDTMALTDLFTKLNGGSGPPRVDLSGISMGGHVTLLGHARISDGFAGGLAMCPSGPGAIDYLTASVAAASGSSPAFEVSGGEPRMRQLMTATLGKPPDYTDKGRQLASVHI